jgi:hypothetical protein
VRVTRGRGGQVAGVDPHVAGGAAVVQVPVAVVTAARAFEHVQGVGFGVAQRPQPVGGRQDQVEGEHRKVLGDPAGGVDDAGGDVPAVRPDVTRDQGEEPFGVGVTANPREVGAEFGVEFGQALDHAVVREQTPVLFEGVRVAPLQAAGGGEADVGDERRRFEPPGLRGETPVLVRGDGRLVQARGAVGGEVAQAGAVRIAPALVAETVGGVEQPERGARTPGRTAHAEQTTHRALTVDDVRS